MGTIDEEEQSTDGTTTHTRSHFGVYAILGLIVLLALSFGAYAHWSSLQAGIVPPLYEAGFSPSGMIYLSLIPSDASRPLGVYTLTIGGDVPQGLIVDGVPTISPSLSPDGSTLLVSRKLPGSSYFQIYTATPDGGNLTQVTNSARIYKREPVMSHDGKEIAYTAQVLDEGRDPTTPSDWRVVVTDLNGVEQYVTRGVDPIFSPDDSELLVLKEGGLYLYDLSKSLDANPADGKVGSLVVPTVGGPGSQTMKLSVSADDSMLIWSSPLSGKVTLYRITSWSPFALTPLRTLDVNAYWSTFSPDGMYFALEEVDGGLHITNPRIVVYSTVTQDSQQVADLSAYDPGYLWMSGWK